MCKLNNNASVLLKLVSLTILSHLMLGCSSFDLIPSDSLIQRLKGRGPVLVSTDNPYIAANLLLKQESDHSKELRGFLEKKGPPSALAVTQDFLEPARIKLFYGNRSEQYDLELLQGIWVITGPKKINDQAVKELISSSLSNDIIVPNNSKQSAQELVPLFDSDSSEDASNKQSETDSSIDALISKYDSAAAETSPRGDIVHYVTSEQETLKIIAKWYTKSELTVSRISRANKISTTAKLRPGDQIVIPVELVKNKSRLPEEAILELSGRKGWSLDFNS